MVGGTYHPVHASLYPVVGVHYPGMPPSMPPVGVLPVLLLPGVDSFISVVEEERPLRKEGGLLSPQNKPLPLQETGLKASRNPPQRVMQHKDLGNLLTPQKVSPNPP